MKKYKTIKVVKEKAVFTNGKLYFSDWHHVERTGYCRLGLTDDPEDAVNIESGRDSDVFKRTVEWMLGMLKYCLEHLDTCEIYGVRVVDQKLLADLPNFSLKRITITKTIKFDDTYDGATASNTEFSTFSAPLTGEDKSNDYVYIMSDSAYPGLYKIGRSNHPKRREETLSHSTPTIALYKVLKTDKATKVEQEIHSLLKEHRVRGEWFKLTDDILDVILYYYKFVDFNKL